ncbi:helix-turn-helix domain-containing protein [Cytobacillus purgationiresistens]|uniref:DNA (Cytosine-5)-methyltransferase 1 n=1 Tax=Cytobacillus purgationiresistens TaxID=863449 RepID=A0ABU0AIA7_9BACI|nr:helix-turn-helix domain-containing protein [Cytobacillus purgationiresistens]MDQ0270780.1 DNA (cytosine-5)-methyltransferase 1 [Cytobacillus purgationiresistens]
MKKVISYAPLFKTLEEKEIVISSLRSRGIHPTTIAKINKNDSVSLLKIEEICIILNVPIEKVVEIKLESADKYNK